MPEMTGIQVGEKLRKAEWDIAFSEITGDTIVTAVYTEIPETEKDSMKTPKRIQLPMKKTKRIPRKTPIEKPLPP